MVIVEGSRKEDNNRLTMETDKGCCGMYGVWYGIRYSQVRCLSFCLFADMYFHNISNLYTVGVISLSPVDI